MVFYALYCAYNDAFACTSCGLETRVHLVRVLAHEAFPPSELGLVRISMRIQIECQATGKRKQSLSPFNVLVWNAHSVMLEAVRACTSGF